MCFTAGSTADNMPSRRTLERAVDEIEEAALSTDDEPQSIARHDARDRSKRSLIERE